MLRCLRMALFGRAHTGAASHIALVGRTFCEDFNR